MTSEEARRLALEKAVEICGWNMNAGAPEVIVVAKQIENYLLGKK